MFHNKRLLVFLLVLTVVGCTVSTIPLQPLYSSSAQQTSDEDQQGGSAGVEEPLDDELVDQPEPAPLVEPEPKPATEPVDDAEPGSLDDGNLIEREKECPKGEYDNGGKCAKIPECTPPESWSAMEKKCRIFPWWLVMR